MTRQQATELLQRYRDGSCSEEEKKIVEHWYASMEADSTREWTEDEKLMFSGELFEKIMSEIAKDEPGKTVSFKKYFGWWKMIAAVLVLCTGAIIWSSIKNNKNEQGPRNSQNALAGHDVLPGKSGAILTLADGQKILLDTAADSTILVQGNPGILNKNGTLTYDEADAGSGPVAYNSIVTPNGRQFKLVLSDGTRVWLNAASSLHYPVYFGPGGRSVEISGEAYFEVAEKKDAKGVKIPFNVKVLHEKGMPAEITVLGTHFNVNAYDDEPDTKVTLLEGSVRVGNTASNPVLIKPGEQAKISEKISIDKNADLEMVMAWKNGVFTFKNADVATVMRQAERWYNIKVEYPNGIPSDTLNGGIPRDVKLSEFLDIIRYSEIRASIQNGIVEIKPAAAGKH